MKDYAIIIVPREGLASEFTQEYYQVKYGTQNPEEEFAGEEKVVLGDPAQPSPSGKARVRGTINNRQSGEPLVGVALYIPAINQAVITDAEGAYQWQLPIGEHEVIVQSIGFEDYKPIMEVYSDARWDIELQPRAYDFEAVIVRETASDANVSATQIGINRLSPKEIKELPTLLGEPDVIRSLLTLPGVTTVGEGATGFNVRGGTIDQNLVMQDGALVFNTAHVLGFFSIFNPDIIRNVTLYKGAIPAQYGGRISSLLEVETLDADPDQFKIRGGIGIVSSKLTTEVPLIKGKNLLITRRQDFHILIGCCD